jgi:two-component system CheB/CheR fusion protein
MVSAELDATPAREQGNLEGLNRCRIVALGASAGGLEAFERFFRAADPGMGMAFVVVQHLSPEHESILPQLLSAFTRMPVQPVIDGTIPLPDHVYVIPPNATLLFRDGRLRLNALEPRSSRQPISALFTSMAAELGPDATAVILSGTGSDGAAGLHLVRSRGGLTIAQSPAEAQYDSMPRSAVATGDVDFVLSAADMPALITREARRRAAQPRQSLGGDPADPLVAITEALRRQTGKEFGAFKRTTVQRRVQRRLNALGMSSLTDYRARLEIDGAEASQLASDLMIGVTRFFRDPTAFEALAEAAVPGLFEHAGDQPVRVWVPGCASGEEAYSLAIQLLQHARRTRGPGGLPRVQVFATDINEVALATARQGRYPAAAMEEVPPELLERHFHREDGVYVVTKEVRDCCIFSLHDVLRDPPFSRVDLISCRNLLIYFDADVQARLLPVFHYALRPSGFLFLGSSETVGDLSHLFEVVDKKHRVFRRANQVDARVRLPLSLHAAELRYARPPPRGEVETGASMAEVLRALLAGLLEERGAAAALVDARGNARYFGGTISRWLPTPTGTPTTNVLELAPAELRLELSAALQAAGAGGGPIRRELALGREPGGPRLDLTVRTLAVPQLSGDQFLVVFREAAPAPAPAGGAPDEARTHALEGELRVATERWRRAVQDLESTNEELRSANEELQTMNEELQSSNEELQLSQEELQSVNEELNTVNAELATKVEEVNGLYADVQNLFQSTRIATVVVDREMAVTRFTPAATRLYPLAQGDLGRRFADLANPFRGAPVLEEARAVLEDLVPRERILELADGSGWHLLRALPYLSLAESIDGVVLTFVDVTDLKETEAALRASEGALREADRRKDEFLAVLGHELRNPLAALGTALALEQRQRGRPRDAGADRHLELMQRQVRALSRLVDDLLDVTRISRGKVHLDLRPVNLCEVVRDELELHRARASGGRRFAFQGPAGPIWVRGDRDRIGQIAGNLLGNAVKFTEPGQEIQVMVEAPADGRPSLVVRDRGIGMSAETLAHLFEPFRQADHSIDRAAGGLGLGLSLVKGMAELMAAEVGATSEGLGRGSEFTVRFSPSPPPEATAPAPPSTAPRQRRRILVIEDNSDVRQSIVELLRDDLGHEVTAAEDGETGVSLAREWRPELVLCDIGLPRLDGYEVAHRLRGDPGLAGLVVAAMTGYGSSADKARAGRAGFDRHFTKPLDVNDLIRFIDGLPGAVSA